VLFAAAKAAEESDQHQSSLNTLFHVPHPQKSQPTIHERPRTYPRCPNIPHPKSLASPKHSSLTDHFLHTDQIARQVEDPGLKQSSQTHVGLELSIRHAAEFFAFYICRFVLADLGLLMDKFVKRGTEWALA
jgi:hypothetical protein